MIERGRLSVLFKKRFHRGIEKGNIDLTFRAWETARVRVGTTCRFSASGHLRIETVDRVPLASISEADARRSGFDSQAELAEYLRVHSSRRLTPRSPVYRVGFRFFEPRVKEPDRSPEAVALLKSRLDRMDRLGRHGPWTRQILNLIGEHPRTAASKLAARVGRETRPFKVDVRKLKKLGLTVSFEVGYDLTPLGRIVRDRHEEGV